MKGFKVFQTTYQPWEEGQDEPDSEVDELSPWEADEADEDFSPVEQAVHFLRGYEPLSFSSSDGPSEGYQGWWFPADGALEFHSGETAYTTIHPEGWSLSELRAIWEASRK